MGSNTSRYLINGLGALPMNSEYTGIECSYEEFVRTLFKQEGFDKMLAHAARGVCTEAGEINDCVKKHLDYEQDFDLKNLIEEIGDMRFYLQALMNLFNISEKTVLSTNIKKLNKRYVDGIFTKEAAAARADKSLES